MSYVLTGIVLQIESTTLGIEMSARQESLLVNAQVSILLYLKTAGAARLPVRICADHVSVSIEIDESNNSSNSNWCLTRPCLYV